MMKAIVLIFFVFLSVSTFAQFNTDTMELSNKLPVIPLEKNAIKVFPNPAVNDVYITVKQQGLQLRNIFLYDKNGNRVFEQKVNSVLSAPVKISTANLPSGQYYLVIETSKQPFRCQLIKQ